MRRNSIFIGAALIASLFVFSAFRTGSAQRPVRWEYASINATWVPFTSENQLNIVGIANICYVSADGCRNEEVRTEVNYSRMVQDFRLDDSESSVRIIQGRARENALSKTIAKLGADGWEMVTAPGIEFDAVIQNRRGNYSFENNPKDVSPDIWFKRLRP